MGCMGNDVGSSVCRCQCVWPGVKGYSGMVVVAGDKVRLSVTWCSEGLCSTLRSGMACSTGFEGVSAWH
jgi:hypothetical protein